MWLWQYEVSTVCPFDIWAMTWQNQQNVCVSSENSDADLNLRWGHSHIVGFVILWLILWISCFAFSSHNWNALFLGANAVADVLAEKYEAEKSKILDTVSFWSLNGVIGLWLMDSLLITTAPRVQFPVGMWQGSGRPSMVGGFLWVFWFLPPPKTTECQHLCLRECFVKFYEVSA